jgi:hypothetical protein
MTLPRLEEYTDILDEATVTILGDPFTLTPYGGAAIPLMGWVDHSETKERYSFTSLVQGDRTIELRKADRASINKDDVFHLPRSGLVGGDFLAKETKEDESGRWWGILLKRKPT